MQLKIIFYNVFHDMNPSTFPKSEDIVVNFDSNTTIEQLFEGAGEPLADLSEYYYLSRPYAFNSNYLPYIITMSGKVCWDISYKKAKVSEFLYTHGIEDYVLEARTVYIQAGGPGFLDISQIWSLIYPVIDQFITIIGFTSVVKNAGKWIHSLFIKDEIPPHSYFDFIFSRDKWNHFELSEYLDINSDDGKQLLKALGYKYDRSKMIYIKQPCSDDLIKKLLKINVQDI